MLKSGSLPFRTQTKQHKTTKPNKATSTSEVAIQQMDLFTPSWTFRSEQQADIKPSCSSSVRTDISNTSLSTLEQPCLSKTDSNEPCSHSLGSQPSHTARWNWAMVHHLLWQALSSKDSENQHAHDADSDSSSRLPQMTPAAKTTAAAASKLSAASIVPTSRAIIISQDGMSETSILRYARALMYTLQ